jgi:hypothetical protein
MCPAEWPPATTTRGAVTPAPVVNALPNASAESTRRPEMSVVLRARIRFRYAYDMLFAITG